MHMTRCSRLFSALFNFHLDAASMSSTEQHTSTAESTASHTHAQSAAANSAQVQQHSALQLPSLLGSTAAAHTNVSAATEEAASPLVPLQRRVLQCGQCNTERYFEWHPITAFPDDVEQDDPRYCSMSKAMYTDHNSKMRARLYSHRHLHVKQQQAATGERPRSRMPIGLGVRPSATSIAPHLALQMPSSTQHALQQLYAQEGDTSPTASGSSVASASSSSSSSLPMGYGTYAQLPPNALQQQMPYPYHPSQMVLSPPTVLPVPTLSGLPFYPMQPPAMATPGSPSLPSTVAPPSVVGVTPQRYVRSLSLLAPVAKPLEAYANDPKLMFRKQGFALFPPDAASMRLAKQVHAACLADEALQAKHPRASRSKSGKRSKVVAPWTFSPITGGADQLKVLEQMEEGPAIAAAFHTLVLSRCSQLFSADEMANVEQMHFHPVKLVRAKPGKGKQPLHCDSAVWTQYSAILYVHDTASTDLPILPVDQTWRSESFTDPSRFAMWLDHYYHSVPVSQGSLLIFHHSVIHRGVLNRTLSNRYLLFGLLTQNENDDADEYQYFASSWARDTFGVGSPEELAMHVLSHELDPAPLSHVTNKVARNNVLVRLHRVVEKLERDAGVQVCDTADLESEPEPEPQDAEAEEKAPAAEEEEPESGEDEGVESG